MDGSSVILQQFFTYTREVALFWFVSLLFWLLRCKLVAVMAEVDRIIRPGGKLIVRDESTTLGEVETLLKSLHWEIIYSKIQEGMLCAKRGKWRPDSVALWWSGTEQNSKWFNSRCALKQSCAVAVTCIWSLIHHLQWHKSCPENITLLLAIYDMT